MWSEHENWKFVRPGIRTIFNQEDGVFYDQYDEQLQFLVEEYTYYNRADDMEVPYINGIYMGEEEVTANPIRHRDQDNRPKYPYVKFGSEPVDEKRFYFYKSIASKMMQDYQLTNRTWRTVIDATSLGMMPPTFVMGEDKLETDIYYPGAAINMDRDTKVESAKMNHDLAAGYQLLNFTDQQINESTNDPLQQGVAQAGTQTAFEVARLEQNARVQLGLIGKMIVQMVKELGVLMIDDIVKHQTVAEVEELLAGVPKLKFKTFLLPDQNEGGSNVTKEIRFSDELIGNMMSDDELESKRQKLFEEEGGLNGKTRIFEVNPSLFRKIKFQIIIDAERVLPRNEALESALMLDAYDKAIRNPLITGDIESFEAVTRDLLLGALRPTKGQEDKYLPKRTPKSVVEVAAREKEEQENPISNQAARSQEAGALSELQLQR